MQLLIYRKPLSPSVKIRKKTHLNKTREKCEHPKHKTNHCNKSAPNVQREEENLKTSPRRARDWFLLVLVLVLAHGRGFAHNQTLCSFSRHLSRQKRKNPPINPVERSDEKENPLREVRELKRDGKEWVLLKSLK